MPHAAPLLDRRCGTQPLPVYEAFPGIWIDREVSHLEGSKVLEEVAALRGGYAKVAESRLHDHTSSRNLVPFDRDSEPGIVRSPASHSDQQIRGRTFAQLRIKVGHPFSHLLAAGALEAVKVDHYDVAQLRDASVAQHLGTLTDEPFGIHIFHPQFFAFARQHQRTDLQEPKLGGFPRYLR